MNRHGFLAGMLAAPFVAKAEFLMPVQKVVYQSGWYDLGFDIGMKPSFLVLKVTDGITGEVDYVRHEFGSGH